MFLFNGFFLPGGKDGLIIAAGEHKTEVNCLYFKSAHA